MEDKITEFIIRIETKLSSIETKVDGIIDQLKDHSQRIQRLEQSSGSSLKSNLLEFALKAIIGLVAVVAALSGAGGILSKILGN